MGACPCAYDWNHIFRLGISSQGFCSSRIFTGLKADISLCPSDLCEDEIGGTHTPCSKNFLTFHIVIRAVGEEEIMMIGLFDLAFLAPLDGSVMSRVQLNSR